MGEDQRINKIGDLVHYNGVRETWLIIKQKVNGYSYTGMKYESVEDVSNWHKRESVILELAASMCVKDIFLTQIMQAELSEWFIGKGVISGR